MRERRDDDAVDERGLFPGSGGIKFSCPYFKNAVVYLSYYLQVN